MAAAVLRRRLTAAGLADQVEVVSAGTAGWHVGAPADQRAAATLRANGYDDAHRARQFNASLAAEVDLVLAMDSGNYSDLLAMTSATDAELRMFREFDPALRNVHAPNPLLDVPDPYYGPDDGFDEVLMMIERAAEGLVTDLTVRLQRRP